MLILLGYNALLSALTVLAYFFLGPELAMALCIALAVLPPCFESVAKFLDNLDVDLAAPNILIFNVSFAVALPAVHWFLSGHYAAAGVVTAIVLFLAYLHGREEGDDEPLQVIAIALATIPCIGVGLGALGWAVVSAVIWWEERKFRPDKPNT